MRDTIKPTHYHPEIGWRTLLTYNRALREFAADPPLNLSYSVFSGLSAVDTAALPTKRFYSASDGCQLGFRCYDADSKIRLVLIHGAGCFGDQLHQIAYAVSKTGRAKAYTLNMRGHGLSEGERGHAVSNAREIVADVSQFLAWLKAERPNDPIILVGHSAGGGVVLGVSRTDACKLVSGYIFLAPYLGLGSATVRPRFGGWITVRSWRFRAIVLCNLFGIKCFNDNTVVEFNMDACLYDPRFVRSWSFNTVLAFGPGPWVAGVAIPAEKPVLVLAGEADQCFVTPLYRYAFKLIAPHAVIRNVGPAGHWDLLVDPGTITAIETWIDKRFTDTFKFSKIRGSRNDAVA